MLLSIKRHKLVFALVGLLLFIALAFLILQMANYKKIAWGLTIAGQSLGGLNYRQAEDKIISLTETLKKQPIELKYQKKHWLFLPEQLGISFDVQQTLQNAYGVGRQKNDNFLGITIDQIEALFGRRQQPLIFQQNKQPVIRFIKDNLSAMESPAKNAKLIYDSAKDDFVLIPAQIGEVFESSDLTTQIAKQAILRQKQPIEIKKIIQDPALTQDLNNLAKIKAKKIIGLTPFQLTYEGNSWPIEKQALLDWLDFVPVANSGEQTMDVVISQSLVKEFLSGLVPSINREPVNATLAIKDQKVIAFSLSQNGWELKIDETAKKISQEILEEKRKISLIVNETEPQISTKTIDTLGLTSLLGQGNSDFAGSPQNRVHNIGIGAAKINGVLLKPSEEFSFIQNIGEIEAKQGYLPELVIKKGKTIPEYGGGICQVSTTLFRAAVNSGLKIAERFPHAFPVKYYNPQGFDATVYPPHPDLRFVNDTPGYLLIQSKIKGTKITFEIYGTKDEREVKLIGPTVLESNPDGSMKTVLYQEIWRAGTLERKDTFRSSYKSPALYPVERNPLE